MATIEEVVATIADNVSKCESLMDSIRSIAAELEDSELPGGGNPEHAVRILDTSLGSLRSAIDKPYGTKMIQTRHGVGYRLLESNAL